MNGLHVTPKFRQLRLLLPLIAVSAVLAGCERSDPASKLHFAGCLSNNDKSKWLNDRLVIVFLENVEVGRAVTQASQYPGKNIKGLWYWPGTAIAFQDGVFSVECPNTYRLKRSDIDPPEPIKVEELDRIDTTPFYETSNAYAILGTWLGETHEGTLHKIHLREKRITYEVRILAGNYAYLPETLKVPGCLRLTESGVLYYADANGSPHLATGTDTAITILETDKWTEKRLLNFLTIPLDNTYGSETIVNEIEDTRTFIHEATTDDGIAFGISIPLIRWIGIQAEIERTNKTRQGEVISRRVTYTLPVKAGTKTVYRINWYELWEHGVALIRDREVAEKVPFKVRTDIVYEIQSAEH
jgi:hypothetical protein